MRLLFVKDALGWPRGSGHDVHSFHMMQALARLGHDVGLVTATEPKPEALAGLPLCFRDTFPGGGPEPALTWFQRKYANYWGTDLAGARAAGRAAEQMKADAVVAVGVAGLPYLTAVPDRLRVWYAADDSFLHHASQVKVLRPQTWGQVKHAALNGLYERTYRSTPHRVWVVTHADRRAMRWVMGAKNIDVIPNGVDGDFFTPLDAEQGDRTCVFWGRLDFGPNVQALAWFTQNVWPRVRRDHPDARLAVFGFAPLPEVTALDGRDGITITADLPDLRSEVARHQVVVLPFVSGGGIKNKFLEAAAMGKPVVCSPLACNGLRHPAESGSRIVSRPADWAAAIGELWADAAKRAAGGAAARRWVLDRHSWDAAARTAAAGLEAGVVPASYNGLDTGRGAEAR